MKKTFLSAAIAATLFGCVGSRYIPDKSIQVTLVKAYRETKTNACTNLPRKLRTWHLLLVTKTNDTIHHHYFTESFVKQKWLVPGDQYTYQYRLQDSIHWKNPYIFAKLKWNK